MPAQAAQMQRCLRSDKGSRASTSGAIQASMHQQFSAAWPSARAQWLPWWHSGHNASEKPGTKEGMVASVGVQGAVSAWGWQYTQKWRPGAPLA